MWENTSGKIKLTINSFSIEWIPCISSWCIHCHYIQWFKWKKKNEFSNYYAPAINRNNFSICISNSIINLILLYITNHYYSRICQFSWCTRSGWMFYLCLLQLENSKYFQHPALVKLLPSLSLSLSFLFLLSHSHQLTPFSTNNLWEHQGWYWTLYVEHEPRKQIVKRSCYYHASVDSGKFICGLPSLISVRSYKTHVYILIFKLHNFTMTTKSVEFNWIYLINIFRFLACIEWLLQCSLFCIWSEWRIFFSFFFFFGRCRYTILPKW